jgi:protein-S-isoprenylcysteine O-methyltransferase Ste14
MNALWIKEASMLYLPVVLGLLLWLLFRPRVKVTGALTMSLLWNIVALYLINNLAIKAEWWEFAASGIELGGIPLLPLVGWSILWGICFPLIPTQNGTVLVLTAIAADLLFMPLLAPLVTLHSTWLVGELVAIAGALIPGLLLYRWTVMKRAIWGRVIAQGVIFGFLILFLLPVLIFELAEGAPLSIPAKPWILATLQIQLMLGFAGLGMLAVNEFVKKGKGTPVPFDSPRHLVTSGPYAYLINPMQFATAGFLLCYGWFLESWIITSMCPMVIFYVIGIANPSESTDLTARFKEHWDEYRAQFVSFLPRFLPIEGDESATIYFAGSCHTCSGFEAWFKARNPTGLRFLPAESYPGGLPGRVTYEIGSDSYSGVKAIARALTHINFTWAVTGWLMQIPGVCQLIQVIVDLEGIKPPANNPGLEEG